MLVSDKTKKILCFISIVSSTALLFTDQSILPVALPTIQREFHSTDTQLYWMINSYLLIMSGLMIAVGRISEIFSHKRFFCLGYIIFILASVFCAMSSNSSYLILFRVLQGIGAACIIPSALSILTALFSEKKRGLLIGINTSIGAFFFATAPIIGGFFTEYLSWRYIFWINIPIALIGLILALIFIPKSKIKKASFDFLGFIAFFVGIISLSVAFMQAKDWHWLSFYTISLLVLSIFSFFFLYYYEKRKVHPFINFKIFQNRPFFRSCFSVFSYSVAISITLYWAIYFQSLLDYSAIKTGFVMLIYALPVVIMSPVGGKLKDIFTSKVPVTIGMSVLVLSFIWFVLFFHTGEILFLLPTLLTIGWGGSFIMTPSYAAAMSSVEFEKRGSASGIITTMRITGRTLGFSVLGSILLNVQDFKFTSALKQNPITAKLDPNIYEGLLSKTSKSVEALKNLSVDQAKIVINSMFNSSMFSFITANIFSLIIFFLSLVIFIQLIKKRKNKKNAPKII